ncbi:unnamed protein product [Peronospora destructor]|uniref:PH domain-containing protein n=1 Tax=Peronospora destructor TaxID=86335 RepID=A0AAV0V4S4_9STRA|nr:unnamed protein product [Peronospora destructor]
MADQVDWLPDLAALALLTVAVHYVLGLYGLLGVLLVFILLEHGPNLTQLKLNETVDERTPSTLTSTSVDDEEQRPNEEEEEPQRVTRRRIANLTVRDVGSIGTPRVNLEMNARTPVAFETDLFAGRALFLVRTQPEDPYYAALFAGKRRMFWIQVQGHFKKTVQGPVYLGGELPSRIAPGLFTRSIALVIMRLIRRLVGHVSFRFGSSTDSEDVDELPAVAFPLFQSVDQFVKTLEGEIPPTLGTDDFGESEEQRTKRRHTPLGEESYEVGPTYTFDFHTMYVDLMKWKTANLPGGLNAMDLASFFDSLPLRLVAYQVRSEGVESFESHCQRDKEYLFSFEVIHDKHSSHLCNGFDVTAEEALRESAGQNNGRGSIVSGIGLSGAGSEMSTMSTTLSDASSMTEEDPVLAQEHANFLRLEHARRLGQLSFSYLCWMEEVDVASDVRRVHYVFAVKDKVGEYDDGDDELAKPLLHYTNCLTKRQRLQEAYTPSTKLSPSRIGVNLSRRDREDMGVVFEGVVYRYYSAELLRQEVLLLTKDDLLFYRSYASSAEKQVSSSHIIGVRAVEVPSIAAYLDGSSGTDSAFALQISTFAEEIVLCVGTSSTRDAWVRGILQYCEPLSNFDHARQVEMYIGFTATTALRPANRAELNSRLLFPQLKLQKPQRGDASDLADVEMIATDTVSGALKLVRRTLTRALHIHNNAQQLSVTEVLAFLDDASALRAVDLKLLQDFGSHEEQVAFYLNLYHTVLAHAMIAQGFPRGKGQWGHFLTRTCYALGCGPEGGQVSLSLAEIEHVILRARLPHADVPYLSVNSVVTLANEPASRLQNLGIAHPDFRLSLALVLNHPGCEKVVIYDPAYVHDQLNATVRSLLVRSSAQGHLEIKKDPNTIVLPRVCEWYRRDFGGAACDTSASYCVRKLLGFMDGRLQLQVIDAMGLDDTPLRTNFRSFKYMPKVTLEEDKSWQASVLDETSASSSNSGQTEGGGGMTHL